MMRGWVAVAAWASASAALAQSPAPILSPAPVFTPSPDLVQRLNAAVFVARPALGPLSPLAWTQAAPGAEDQSAANPQAVRASTTVTIWSPGGIRQRLEAMGVKDGDVAFGHKGRIYLFAAVQGQAVGLNLQGLQRAGWSTDYSSALIGDGQVGVGWRKGGFEADLGYVRRSTRFAHSFVGMSDSYTDDVAAVSIAFHPGW
jgi:hypothetical protein